MTIVADGGCAPQTKDDTSEHNLGLRAYSSGVGCRLSFNCDPTQILIPDFCKKGTEYFDCWWEGFKATTETRKYESREKYRRLLKGSKR